MGLKIARITDAKTAQELTLQAVKAYEAGDLAKAHKSLMAALELNPNDGQLFLQVGSVLVEMEAWDKALIAAKTAVQLMPFDANGYNLLGFILFKLRLFDLAEKCFRKTLEFDPNHKTARTNLVESIRLAKVERHKVPSEFDEIKKLLEVRKPTVALCMIVKNEEKFLADCLESVQGAVDEICIVDTGSTDKTVEIAKRYGAKIGHFEWTGDFAVARNKSIELATADWILILDADEVITPESKEEIRTVAWDKTKIGYSCVIENLLGDKEGDGKQMALIFRFFQNRPDMRYEGRIHEQAIPAAQRTGLPNGSSRIRIIHRGYLNKWMVDRDKHQRNLNILLEQEREEPNNPFCHFNLGQTYKLLGERDLSEKHYCRALDILKDARTPNTIPYYAGLFFSYADLLRLWGGRDKEALAVAEEGLAAFPTFADLHFTRGTILLSLDRFDEALKVYEGTRKFAGQVFAGGTDPGVATYKATNAIGVCYAKMGKAALAKQYFKRALKEWPSPNAEIHTNLGILYLAEENYQAALGHFTSALEIDSGCYQGWLNLGSVCFKLGNLEEAIAAWRQAIILQPNAADIHYLIGQAHVRQLAADSAIAAFEAELRICPAHASATLALGWAQFTAGSPTAALKTWQDFVAANPDSDRLPEFRSAQLFVQVAGGAATTADDLRATGLVPEAMSSQWIQVLDMSAEFKLFREVETIAEQSAVLSEVMPDFEEQLGRFFLKWKLYDLAIAFLLRQRERTPENADLYYLLGEACQALGKAADAIVMYQACVGINPRHAMARTRLDRLQAQPA
ncbi:MAG: tetratricopeptide repeat protein [Cyanobacteria bacterium REEB65]|nr:tetratricopeptide repeat protein [Cyanobacteria bacterium REEB65]